MPVTVPLPVPEVPVSTNCADAGRRRFEALGLPAPDRDRAQLHLMDGAAVSGAAIVFGAAVAVGTHKSWRKRCHRQRRRDCGGGAVAVEAGIGAETVAAAVAAAGA